MSAARVARAIGACAALLPIPVAVHAQDAPPSGWARANDATGATASTTVSWLGAWSPLRPTGDMARGLLRAPLGPGLLDAPPPVVGAFLLTGAPAALARDFTPRLAGDTVRFGELRMRTAREQGNFHRPLDVAENAVTQASGFGWAPAGSRGTAIGRFVIDRETIDVSAYTARPAPYGSSPFVFTDSVRPPMRRTGARLEGALGFRVGGFGLGLAAGIDTREHNSVDAPLRRNGRATTPAISLGAERVLPWAGVRVGGYYRWSQPTETNFLNPVPLPQITVYGIQGYEEPFGLPLPAGTVLFVRTDKRATAVGGTVEATLLGTRLVVTHEASERAEDQYRRVANVQPLDRWRATGRETRLAAQRMLGSRLRATVVGGLESLEGDATRMDLTGIAMRGQDERLMFETDLRLAVNARWNAALTAGFTRVTSERQDFVANLSSAVESPTAFASLEVARRIGRASVAVGGSGASVAPTGSVPIVAARGPNYQRLIAPGLAYDAAEARAVAGWVTAVLPVRGVTLLASVRAERASPVQDAPARLQPAGERSQLGIVIGLRP